MGATFGITPGHAVNSNECNFGSIFLEKQNTSIKSEAVYLWIMYGSNKDVWRLDRHLKFHRRD